MFIGIFAPRSKRILNGAITSQIKLLSTLYPCHIVVFGTNVNVFCIHHYRSRSANISHFGLSSPISDFER